LSVALTVKFEVVSDPCELAVPVIVPLALKVIPDGTEPLTTEYVGVPPSASVAVSVIVG
jgi:hypothetical protein